jgi:hypothetical protein
MFAPTHYGRDEHKVWEVGRNEHTVWIVGRNEYTVWIVGRDEQNQCSVAATMRLIFFSMYIRVFDVHGA